jgi:hypothetical protein
MANMTISSNVLRYLSAAGILALGTVGAAAIFTRQPSTQGPDPQQLALLAARVESAEAEPPLTLSAPPPRPRVVRIPPAVQRSRKPAATAAAPKPTASAPAPAPPAPAVSPAEAGVKQIALMGVTQQGDEITAWLVDLATQAREEAEAGDSAFGFDVKEVSADSVVLTQGTEEFTVRLGEKEIPVVVAETPAATSPVQSAGAFVGRGNRGWRNNSRSASSNRWNAGQSRSTNWGGNSGSNNSNRGRVTGGFPRGFSGGFSGRGNQSSQSFLTSSANPQEARRRGVSFIGDGDPLPQPAQIQNPQTLRRRGGSAGPAFGQANGNNRTTNNRSRTGGNGRTSTTGRR